MNGTPLPPTAQTPAFKNRRTGLMVFGVLEILFGVLCLLLIPLMIFGQLMTAQMTEEPARLSHVIPGALFYGLLGGLLIWLGLGSFKQRRWARALSLIAGWSWLAIGVLSVTFMVFLLPGAMKPGVETQQMPNSVTTMIMVVTLLFMSVFLIAVPAAIVLFYSSRHVKATCEAYDPVPRWTDARPLPVLALSLWLGIGALTILAMPLSTNAVLPAFGTLLTGAAAWLACLVIAGVWAYAAWETFNVRVIGWWVALITICVLVVSAWMTFSRVNLIDMYKAMGYPNQQIEMMQQMPMFQGNSMAWISLASAIPMIVLILGVKRYFGPPPSSPQEGLPPQ